MWLKITSKINANRPAKNKLINQKKSRLKAEGLLDPPLKETGLRKPFVQNCIGGKIRLLRRVISYNTAIQLQYCTKKAFHGDLFHATKVWE